MAAATDSPRTASTISLATGGTRGFTYDAAGSVTAEARPGGTYGYPGLHPAIIPRELWDRVQARLLSAGARPRRSEQDTTDGVAGLASSLAESAAPGRVRHNGSVGASAALLGKLVDETGDRLTPSRTAARGRSYLYYVSNRLIAGGLDPSGWRLPAPALEREVARRIATHLRAAAGRHEILAEADARSAVALAARAEALATNIERAPAALLPTLVACGTILTGEMQITLEAGALAETLGVSAAALDPALLSTAFRFALRRRGIETKLVVGEHVPLPDRNLQRALLEAHREMALRRDGRRRAETPDSAAISGSRTRRRSYLAFLSPRIQQAILAGEVPEGLTLEVLLRQDLPLDWNEQARLFGFTADGG